MAGLKSILKDFQPQKTLDDFHGHRVDSRNFVIYVGGEPAQAGIDPGSEPGVEYMMADKFEINLAHLSSISTARPILIILSSCGGNWDEGMQMFGAILACPNPVTVLAVKWARSMTSLIPLAADKFVIRPPAKYMFHHGSMGFSGLVQEWFTTDTELRKSRELMLRIYSTRLHSQGLLLSANPESIKQRLELGMKEDIDVWLSADEAVEWGFADEVFAGDLGALRAKKVNTKRRAEMLEVLRRPINVTTKVE